jgi:hypothetical protein
VTTFTDRRGKVTTYTYDGLNRRTFAGFGTLAGPTYESSITYTFDSGNRLVAQRDCLSLILVQRRSETYDVDVIAEIASYAYTVFSERLRKLGFAEDSSEDAPLCRWQIQDMKLDVMALDEKILGFSNRWYQGALKESQPVALPSGVTIRAITSPYSLGTKIEAFFGRGKNDFLASHDLEDVMAVIDGLRLMLKKCSRQTLNYEHLLVLRCNAFSTNRNSWMHCPVIYCPTRPARVESGLLWNVCGV